MAWSPRSRCYFSIDVNKEHPVPRYFDKNLRNHKNVAFIGETYVARIIRNKTYMTEFNKSMSLIKNPNSADDVGRIRLALFDYAIKNKTGDLTKIGTPLERFNVL